MTTKNLRILISLCVMILNNSISKATESQIELIDMRGKLTGDLLIYPTPATFKHVILPFLSSENVIRTFYFFKNLHPALKLSKWLEYFESNRVLNIAEEPKTLYWFPSSPSKPILYSHTI